MGINRRKFLKYTGVATLALASGGVLAACGDATNPTAATNAAATTAKAGAAATSSASTTAAAAIANTRYAALDPRNLTNFVTPLNLPGSEGALGIIEASAGRVDLVAKPLSLELLKGKKADLLTYQVSQNGKSFVNPILKLKEGETFNATLTNNLAEETNLHWHGLQVDWRMDGHPSRPVIPGANFSYNFPVQNRGGTYWYHSHPHKLTPRQAYLGLASFFIVEDEDNVRLNQVLDLKLGETDLPVVIQDKLFDENGNLLYQMDAPTQFMGFFGDTILANLAVNAKLDVSTRLYRLRLLNGSNARTYRLALVRTNGNEKLPYWLIGTDGGLLDRPYKLTEVFLSPGERVELLVDFQNLAIGESVALKSLSFDPMHNEMMGMGMGTGTGMGMGMGMMTPGGGMLGGHMGHSGMMGGTTPSNSNSSSTGMAGTVTSRLDDGQEFFILKFSVKNKVEYNRTIPQTLSTITSLDLSAASPRPLVLSQAMMQPGSQMMQWLINGKSFNMDEYLITVKKGASEIWEIRNEAQSMPHPMHLHGFQFQVVERLNSPNQIKGLATYPQGRLATDLGWKDTVLIWPGESIRLALNFAHKFEGEQTYVLHCHVLEHEDNGMMLNYKVV